MANKTSRSNGIAVLPLVIIVSFIILTVGLAIAFVTYFDNAIAFSARKAAEAQATAQAGINDALQKILLDPTFPGFASSSYALDVGDGTAAVTITKGFNDNAGASASCNNPQSDQTCIESLGTAQNRQKKIRAIVSISPDTGQVVLVSIREVVI